MPRPRTTRRRSRSSTKRWWAATAIAVALSIGAGVVVANGHDTPGSLQTSASIRGAYGGWGRGGHVMLLSRGESTRFNRGRARRRLNVRWESTSQWLAWYERWHAQQYRYYLSHRKHHRGGTGTTATPTASPTTATPTAAPTTAAPTTAAAATPTTTATASPTTTPTAAATATATPTASPTTTAAAGVTQVTSPNWAGYAVTGAAGTFTSVAASWTVPATACPGGTFASSDLVGLDGDGTSTFEQIGTEDDCNGVGHINSAWFEVSPAAPVTIDKPVVQGDVMTASVTALGAGVFMLTLFDMTQNWSVVTEQTSATATLGSAEVVTQAPILNGQVQPLTNFGTVVFSDAAINNAAITAPINEITMVSAAGNTLAVPSTITGGVGNFAVGWDASA